MSAALYVQKALRKRLTADCRLTTLVPAENMIDASGRPERFPCIIMGEDQEIRGDEVARRYFRVIPTLHVWNREVGLTGVKMIVGAIRAAIFRTSPVLDPIKGRDWNLDLQLDPALYQGRCLDLRYEGARFLRDPDGLTSHAVVTLGAFVELPT